MRDALSSNGMGVSNKKSNEFESGYLEGGRTLKEI
jgi:hypothetical protein